MARDSNLLILDEPTNDLDIETLDLLQELLDQYDGTVMLVSHDRDFLDRVVTKTIAMEGNGKVTAYAGGWSDYQSQRGPVEKPGAEKAKATAGKAAETQNTDKSATGFVFYRKTPVGRTASGDERLEAEIAKLEEYLVQPDLFTNEPLKFNKASDALVERHSTLSDAEEEWMMLEEKAAL